MPASEQFADDQWVMGANVCDFGAVFTTRMVIARLSDGSLWIGSPDSRAYGAVELLKNIP